MNKTSSTKRALVASILVLAMCFSMLVGTTFAWFTDSVTSSGNVIETGTLKVDLEVLDKETNNWNSVKANKDPIFNYTNWEPGYVQAKLLRVENEGSLALKWKAVLSSDNALTALADVIDVYVKAWGVRASDNLDDVVYPDLRSDLEDYEKVGTLAEFIAGIETTTHGTLEAGEKAYLAIAFKMQTTAGDEYQNMSLGAFDLQIVATQKISEDDSFGTDYDADASYPTVSAPVARPENATEKVVIKTTDANGDTKNSVELPAELVNQLPADVTEIAVEQSEPTVDGAGNLKFTSVELVDQDGNVIDLGDNEVDLTVTYNVADYYEDGEEVSIYHDGELVAVVTVINGEVTYTVKHFCEVTLSKVDFAKNEDGVWTVDSIEELILFASLVNGGKSFKGETVALTSDIDLENMLWTPIGTSDASFNGTFDGQGYTVSNLYVDSASVSYVGLFGFTRNGAVKNLTVNNAKVSGYCGVGVVAGSPYTSTYSNVTVTGHVEVLGFAYVGGVGGRNAYASWDNITVDVDETSFVKANSVEGAIAYRTYVGGVIGFMGEGGHKVSNVTSNIDVIGSTIDVGGIVGIAHYGNSFENIVCTGDVTVTDAADAVDADEIGGIAGVWNNGGSPVTFTNCSFEGKLSANVEDVDLYNNTVTGAAYNKSGNGKLVIDGVEYVAVNTADELVAALEAGNNVIFVDNIVIDPAGMSNAYGTTGINVKNGQTIDGNGFTLDIHGAGGTWDSGINTTGGVIKNIWITGAFRGIFVNHNSTHSEPVVLDNVVIDGTVYTISCDQGMNQTLVATNCTFNGWTSFAATLGSAEFVNCKFGEGSGYAYCRPYAPTTFVNCEFEAGFEMDARAAVTLENCTLGGEKITAENYATLVIGNADKATVK